MCCGYLLKNFFVLILLICFTGCHSFRSNRSNGSVEILPFDPNQEVVWVGDFSQNDTVDTGEISKIIINFALDAKVKRHLELEDSWVEFNNQVQKMVVRFSSQRLLTLYDARLLLVEVVESLLGRLNQNQIVAFQFQERPFRAQHLDLTIVFENYYGRYIDELYIGNVRLHNGTVYFSAFDAKDRSYNGIDWAHCRCEPYQKSKELALLKKEADISFSQQ